MKEQHLLFANPAARSIQAVTITKDGDIRRLTDQASRQSQAGKGAGGTDSCSHSIHPSIMEVVVVNIPWRGGGAGGEGVNLVMVMTFRADVVVVVQVVGVGRVTAMVLQHTNTTATNHSSGAVVGRRRLLIADADKQVRERGESIERLLVGGGPRITTVPPTAPCHSTSFGTLDTALLI